MSSFKVNSVIDGRSKSSLGGLVLIQQTNEGITITGSTGATGSGSGGGST